MSVPGFLAERSLGKTGGAYRSIGALETSTGLLPAARNLCGVNCYSACQNDPLCLALCFEYQRSCPQPSPPCCQDPNSPLSQGERTECLKCQCCDYYQSD